MNKMFCFFVSTVFLLAVFFIESLDFLFFCSLFVFFVFNFLYAGCFSNLLNINNSLSILYLGSIPFVFVPYIVVEVGDYYSISVSVYRYMALFFYLVPFFYFLSSLWFGSRSGSDRFYSALSNGSGDILFCETFYKVALFVSFFFTSAFLVKYGGIPLLADNPEVARVEAMKGNGVFHRLSFLSLHLSAAMYAIFLYKKGCEKIPAKGVFLFVFLAFYNALTGPRAEPLMALVILFLSYQIINYRRVLFFKNFVFISFVMIVVAVLGGVRYSGIDGFNLEDTTQRFVNRIYMNAVNSERIYYFFSGSGETINTIYRELYILLPGHQLDLATMLKNRLFIDFDGGGITIPVYMEGFLNGRYLGLIFVSFLTVFFIRFVEFFSNKFMSPAVFCCFAIVFSIHMMGVLTMGFSGMVVKNIIPLFISLFVIVFVVKLYALVKISQRL